MSGYQTNGISGIGLSCAVFAINNGFELLNSSLKYTLADPAAFTYNGINLVTSSIIALPNATSVYKINIILSVISPTSGNNYLTFYIQSSISNNPYTFEQRLAAQEYLVCNTNTVYTVSFLHYSAINGKYITVMIEKNPDIPWNWNTTGNLSRIQIDEI